MWECSAEHVRAEVAKFAGEAVRAMLPNAPLSPGDKQCQWCPVRATCSARTGAIMDAYPADPSDGGRLSAHITDEELAAALDRADFIESWCRDIRAEALRRATGGTTIPGYKLIEGKRGNRRWVDSSMAELELKSLGVDPHDHKLISPTEAQRRLKAANASYEVVSWNVEQPNGSPSLAKWNEEGKPLPKVEFGLEEAQ